jgi:pimeloyl-ACP methyl ester carboxylesterase
MKPCLHIVRQSVFKDPVGAQLFFLDWVKCLEKLNGLEYQKLSINSLLGKTIVWACNHEKKSWPAITLFPGFRTSALFWDLDNVLAPLRKRFRIYMIEVNGQPNLSDGGTPQVRNEDYGFWAADVLIQLGLDYTTVAGVSFGGFICKKLSMVAPHLVNKVVLMNPAGFQQFSPNFKNLYYSVLPVVSTSTKNVKKFLEQAIFYKEHHSISPQAFALLVEYEMYAIRQFSNRSQFPYVMSRSELQKVNNPVSLILGERDILFPYGRTIQVAEKHLNHLEAAHVLSNTGHGIETSPQAICYLAQIADKE